MGRTERRKRETLLQFLWAVSDATAGFAAVLLAYAVRFHSPFTEIVPVTKGVPPLGPYVAAGAVLSLVWLPLYGALGLYRVEPSRGPLDTFARIARASALAILIGAALLFFYRGFSFSRALVPVLFVCLFATMLSGRALVSRVSRRWRRRRPLRMLLVGDAPAGAALLDRRRARDPIGVVVAGRLVAADAPLARRSPAATPGAVALPVAADAPAIAPVLGTYAEAARVVTENRIDVVVLALSLEESEHAGEVVTACRDLLVDVELVPDVLQLSTRRARVRDLDGLPVLSLREIPLSGWNAVKKRAFDLALSCLGLLLAAPILAGVALAIRIEGGGPVLYRQERIGRDGRRFSILKFRTMREGAERATGPVFAGRGDRRRTRIGAFLRQWSLDELPQLVNVLCGEMSLVGPRPERPHFVSRFSEDLPEYGDRHRVKSGITGWAQVNGLRGDTSIEARTRHDLYYVENWSLRLDVEILLRTVRAVLAREEAY